MREEQFNQPGCIAVPENELVLFGDEITDVYLRNMVRDAFVTVASTRAVEDVYGSGKSDASMIPNGSVPFIQLK